MGAAIAHTERSTLKLGHWLAQTDDTACEKTAGPSILRNGSPSLG